LTFLKSYIIFRDRFADYHRIVFDAKVRNIKQVLLHKVIKSS